jgi:hypothetical protein
MPEWTSWWQLLGFWPVGFFVADYEKKNGNETDLFRKKGRRSERVGERRMRPWRGEEG